MRSGEILTRFRDALTKEINLIEKAKAKQGPGKSEMHNFLVLVKLAASNCFQRRLRIGSNYG
jgi:hypothetical protein